MASAAASPPPTYSTPERSTLSSSDRQTKLNAELIAENAKLREEVVRLQHEANECRQQAKDAQVALLTVDFGSKYEAARQERYKNNSDPDSAAPTAFWSRLQTLLDVHDSNEESHEAKLIARLEKLSDKQSTEAKQSSKSKDARPPIKFKDAVGRKFSFPFYLCETWSGIENLIMEIFDHVDKIGQHVKDGHYDLLNASGEIIVRSIWEQQIEPGMHISMAMWPMSSTPPPPPPPGPAVKPFSNFAPGVPPPGGPTPRPPPGLRNGSPPRPYPGMGPFAPPRPPLGPPPPMMWVGPKPKKPKKTNVRPRSPSVSSMSSLEPFQPRKKTGWGWWRKLKGLFKRKPKRIRLLDDLDSDSDYTIVDD